MLPSLSLLLEPSNVTLSPSVIFWSSPAIAIGGIFCITFAVGTVLILIISIFEPLLITNSKGLAPFGRGTKRASKTPSLILLPPSLTDIKSVLIEILELSNSFNIPTSCFITSALSLILFLTPFGSFAIEYLY